SPAAHVARRRPPPQIRQSVGCGEVSPKGQRAGYSHRPNEVGPSSYRGICEEYLHCEPSQRNSASGKKKPNRYGIEDHGFVQREVLAIPSIRRAYTLQRPRGGFTVSSSTPSPSPTGGATPDSWSCPSRAAGSVGDALPMMVCRKKPGAMRRAIKVRQGANSSRF